MEADLVRPVQRRQHGEVEHTARLLIEPGPVPDLAPAPFGDELLERLGECVGVRDRAVDIFSAEHLPPHRQTSVKKLAVSAIISHLVSSIPRSRQYAASSAKLPPRRHGDHGVEMKWPPCPQCLRGKN